MNEATDNYKNAVASPAELSAGAAALKAYIDQMLESNGLAWEEMFIPDAAYEEGAADAIEAADGAADQSANGRLAAASAALRSAIDLTGQGGSVSDRNISEGAQAILVAMAKVRAQDNPPVPQTQPTGNAQSSGQQESGDEPYPNPEPGLPADEADDE